MKQILQNKYGSALISLMLALLTKVKIQILKKYNVS